MNPTFAITAASTDVTLDAAGTGSAAFTVTNTSAVSARCRLVLAVSPDANATWFSIEGDATRPMPPGAVAKVVVDIAVPPGTGPGRHAFRLGAAAEANPDEDFSEGPWMSFSIAAGGPPPHRSRWWIAALVVAALVGIAIAIAVARGGGPEPVTTSTATTTTTPPPPPPPVRTVEDWRVDAYASPGGIFAGEHCVSFDRPHGLPAGWHVDRDNGDPGHPGVRELDVADNQQSRKTLRDYNYSAESDTVVRVRGRICGAGNAGPGAIFARTYRIYEIRPGP